MKVSELIAELQKLAPDLEALIADCDGNPIDIRELTRYTGLAWMDDGSKPLYAWQEVEGVVLR